MIDQIKKQLIEKLNLDDVISEQATRIVLDIVKSRLPEGLQGIVDTLIDNDAESEDGEDSSELSGQILDMAKGFFK